MHLIKVDCYFRAHIEYKRPDGGLKIPWSALKPTSWRLYSICARKKAYNPYTRDVQYIMRLWSLLLRFTKYKDTSITIININHFCSSLNLEKRNSFIKPLWNGTHGNMAMLQLSPPTFKRHDFIEAVITHSYHRI